MPEAARVGDEVTHSKAKPGAIIGGVAAAIGGAVVGALLGAALVAATVATGGAALAVVGAVMVAGGGTLALSGFFGKVGSRVGAHIGQQITTPSGPILTGSPNVWINKKPAAVACLSTVGCLQHGPTSLVAQGSQIVTINRKMAARVGDRGTCDFVIGKGSDNVFIGGPTGTCAAITGEVPASLDKIFDTMMLVGGGIALVGSGMMMFAAGIAAAGTAGVAVPWASLSAQVGARLVAQTALGAGLSYGGAYMGNRAGGWAFGEGSFGQEMSEMLGSALGPLAGGRTIAGIGNAPFRGLPTAPRTPAQNPRVYRVQGGTPPRQISHQRLTAGPNGELKVVPEPGKTRQTKLYVTFDDPQRARVYLRDNRPGGQVVSYEVNPAFVQEVRAAAKPQAVIRQHRDAPEISDPTKTTPEVRGRLGLEEHESSAYGLPEPWIRRLEEAAIPGTGRIEE